MMAAGGREPSQDSQLPTPQKTKPKRRGKEKKRDGGKQPKASHACMRSMMWGCHWATQHYEHPKPIHESTPQQPANVEEPCVGRVSKMRWAGVVFGL